MPPPISDIESQIPPGRAPMPDPIARACIHVLVFLLGLMLIMATTATIATVMARAEMASDNPPESFEKVFEKSVGRAIGVQAIILILCMIMYIAYLPCPTGDEDSPSARFLGGEPGIGNCACSCGMFGCLFHCHLRA